MSAAPTSSVSYFDADPKLAAALDARHSILQQTVCRRGLGDNVEGIVKRFYADKRIPDDVKGYARKLPGFYSTAFCVVFFCNLEGFELILEQLKILDRMRDRDAEAFYAKHVHEMRWRDACQAICKHFERERSKELVRSSRTISVTFFVMDLNSNNYERMTSYGVVSRTKAFAGERLRVRPAMMSESVLFKLTQNRADLLERIQTSGKQIEDDDLLRHVECKVVEGAEAADSDDGKNDYDIDDAISKRAAPDNLWPAVAHLLNSRPDAEVDSWFNSANLTKLYRVKGSEADCRQMSAESKVYQAASMGWIDAVSIFSTMDVLRPEDDELKQIIRECKILLQVKSSIPTNITETVKLIRALDAVAKRPGTTSVISSAAIRCEQAFQMYLNGLMFKQGQSARETLCPLILNLDVNRRRFQFARVLSRLFPSLELPSEDSSDESRTVRLRFVFKNIEKTPSQTNYVYRYLPDRDGLAEDRHDLRHDDIKIAEEAMLRCLEGDLAVRTLSGNKVYKELNYFDFLSKPKVLFALAPESKRVEPCVGFVLSTTLRAATAVNPKFRNFFGLKANCFMSEIMRSVSSVAGRLMPETVGNFLSEEDLTGLQGAFSGERVPVPILRYEVTNEFTGFGRVAEDERAAQLKIVRNPNILCPPDDAIDPDDDDQNSFRSFLRGDVDFCVDNQSSLGWHPVHFCMDDVSMVDPIVPIQNFSDSDAAMHACAFSFSVDFFFLIYASELKPTETTDLQELNVRLINEWECPKMCFGDMIAPSDAVDEVFFRAFSACGEELGPPDKYDLGLLSIGNYDNLIDASEQTAQMKAIGTFMKDGMPTLENVIRQLRDSAPIKTHERCKLAFGLCYKKPP